MDIARRVRQFVVENFYVDAEEVAVDTLLITSGLVDSTGMLELISFLEAEFAIRIADHEATPENLESVARIVSFVARKQGSSAAA